MKRWFSYSAGICFSLALHSVLLVVLIYGWEARPEPRKAERPRYIEATLLEVKPKSRPVQPLKAKPPVKPVEDKAAKQRREQELQRQKHRKEQAVIEKKRRDAAVRAKAAKAKVAKAKAAKEKAERDKADKAKAEREKRELQQREQRLLDTLNEEQEFLESEQDLQLVGSYSAYIQQRVVNNWSRPPSARRGMVVELAIRMQPTGQVVSVTIVKPSGNDAFDRSAQRAVQKVERFERLQELAKTSPSLFEREFRSFRLVFKPEDLRL